MDNKFDAPLRMKIYEIERGGLHDSLECFILLTAPPDEQKRTALQQAGIRILSSVQRLIAVRGTIEALREAASYEFVEQISFSHLRSPDHARPHTQ